jgi:hypothetical protein
MAVIIKCPGLTRLINSQNLVTNVSLTIAEGRPGVVAAGPGLGSGVRSYTKSKLRSSERSDLNCLARLQPFAFTPDIKTTTDVMSLR